METLLKGKKIAKEWNISTKFEFDTNENREVRLVLDSIEEYIWRKSGKFSEKEIDAIHEMYGVMRQGSQNDRKWYPIDRQSLNDFLETVNSYENRDKYLEECTTILY